jgi:hypothetical protein
MHHVEAGEDCPAVLLSKRRTDRNFHRPQSLASTVQLATGLSVPKSLLHGLSFIGFYLYGQRLTPWSRSHVNRWRPSLKLISPSSAKPTNGIQTASPRRNQTLNRSYRLPIAGPVPPGPRYSRPCSFQEESNFSTDTQTFSSRVMPSGRSSAIQKTSVACVTDLHLLVRFMQFRTAPYSKIVRGACPSSGSFRH